MEGVHVTWLLVIILGLSAAVVKSDETETGCPTYTTEECEASSSDECTDAESCKLNYPDSDKICCIQKCSDTKSLCLDPVAIGPECTRGNETFSDGQVGIPSAVGDCNTCNCSNGNLLCSQNTCHETETGCPTYTTEECEASSSDECTDAESCKLNYPDSDKICCIQKCSDTKSLCLDPVAIGPECTRGNETFSDGQVGIPSAVGDCNTCNCSNGNLLCSQNTCQCTRGNETFSDGQVGIPSAVGDCNTCNCSNGNLLCSQNTCHEVETGCPTYTTEECEASSSDECTDAESCKLNYPDSDKICCIQKCSDTKSLCLDPVAIGPECTRGNETFSDGQVGIPSAVGDCNTCNCSNGNLLCSQNTCRLAQDGCNFLRNSYRVQPFCTKPAICECTRENETFPNRQVGIPSTVRDSSICNRSSGTLLCSKNTCHEVETGCPTYTTEECEASSSDECTDAESCKLNYPDSEKICCIQKCSDTKSLCLDPVAIGPECTRGNETFSDGQVGIPSAVGDCNTCNCSNGNLLCSQNTCPGTCERDGETYEDGETGIAIDCNTCNCTSGSLECTEKQCTCDYDGDTKSHGETFRSSDGCNECSCSDGEVRCTDMACMEPCSMEKFRECFVRMAETSVYVITRSDKLLMCNTRTVVEVCVERNLVQCRDDFGAIMTEVLKPFANMFMTIGDTFCKRDEEDRPYIQRAEQCILDFARVAVHGSVLATCRQARVSLECVREATHSCSDRSRNIFAMVTDVMENTLTVSCKPDTCNIGMAEHCIEQAYIALYSPLYREGGSLFTCSHLRSSIECASSYTANCVDLEDEGMPAERPGDARTGELDRMAYQQYDEEHSDGDDSTVIAFLDYINELKEQMPADVEDEKRLTTGEECHLPATVGPCKAAIPRWFFNSTSMTCEKFIYGGCLGNRNNFEKLEECNKNCASTKSGREANNRNIGMSRLVTLLTELNGKSDSDDEINPQRMIEELESNVEAVKRETANAVTGNDLKIVAERMRRLLEHVNELIEESEISLDTEIFSEEVREELEETRMHLEGEIDRLMRELKDRFESIKESIGFLMSKTEGFCMEVAEVQPADMEPANELILVIGALLSNPFTNMERICSLYDNLTVQMNKDTEMADEVHEDLKPSFEFMSVIVDDLCAPKVEEECIPMEEPEQLCDAFKTVHCLNTIVFVEAVKEALRDDRYDTVCDMAEDALKCANKNTSACEPENMDHTLALSQKMRIERIISTQLQEKCLFNLEPECKPVPVCEPTAAIEECFPIPGEYEDFCLRAKESLLPCLHGKLAACRFSVEVSLVQAKLDRYLATYDADGLCEINRDFLYDDITRPVSQCYIEHEHALTDGLRTQPTFHRAVCIAEAAYYHCMQDKEVPVLYHVLQSQHERFYKAFWDENCSWLEEMNGNTTQEEEITLPVLEGCNIHEAVQAVEQFWDRLSGLVGIYWSTDKYAEACSMDNLNSLEELFTNGLGDDCPVPARDFFRSGLPFFSSLRDEHCPLDIRTPEGSCSLDEVRMCVSHFGLFMAQYSPNGDMCGQLGRSLDCITDYAVDCDEETEAEIQTEIEYLRSISGNEECGLPRWCSVEGRRKREAEMEDQHMERPNLSENLLNLTCTAPPACDVIVASCFKDSPEETCSNTDEVKACISDKVIGCPVALKIMARSNVEAHLETFPEDCDLIAEDLSQLVDEELNTCAAQLGQSHNGTRDICTAINNFNQCMRSDLSNEELPATYQGILTVQVNLMEAFYNDHCIGEGIDCRAVRCMQPDCENRYIPEGQCCEVCGQDCSLLSCPAPECEDAETYVPPGECCPKCREEPCPAYDGIVENLATLVRKVSMVPFTPVSSRAAMCDRGEEIFMETLELIESCPEDGLGREEFQKAMKFLESLIDIMGFCSDDPMPRNCDIKQAMTCVTDMGMSFLEAEMSGFKYSMCSQSLLQKMCVGISTLGCPANVKQMVEKTLWSIKGVVDEACTIRPLPVPSMQCKLEEDMGPGCDVTEATKCLYKLHSDLACDQPEWDTICPKVPYVTSCVERHLYTCNREQKRVVKEIAEGLMSRVREHCPQVDCNVCEAQRCIDRLSDRIEDENYCSNAMAVEACVKRHTEHCDREHAADVWTRMTRVSEYVEEVCQDKLHRCLSYFRETAMALTLYDGPTFADSESEEPREGNQAREEDSRNRDLDEERMNCETLFFEREPWWRGDFEKVLWYMVTENGERNEDTESENDHGSHSSGRSESEGSERDGSDSDGSESDGSDSDGSDSDGSDSDGSESDGSAGEGSSDETGTRSSGKAASRKKRQDVDDEDEDEMDGDDDDGENDGDDDADNDGDDEDDGDNDGDDDDDADADNDGDDDDGDSDGENGDSDGEGDNADADTDSNDDGDDDSADSDSEANGDSDNGADSDGDSDYNDESDGFDDLEGPWLDGRCAHQRPVPLHPDLFRLCTKLYTAFSCVDRHLFLLDESVRETVKISLSAVLQTASEKCRAIPLQCHYCHKAGSVEECDALQEVDTCKPTQPFCVTSMVYNTDGEFKFINKGCRSADWCVSNEVRDKSCCTTHLCNTGGLTNETTPQPEPMPTCSIFTQTYCALTLASTLARLRHIDCRTMFESINCMTTIEESCETDELSQMLMVYTHRIKQTRAWTSCLAQERNCRCGGNAVLTLNPIFNPYTSEETVCNHFTSVSEIAMNLDWKSCGAEDHVFVKTNFALAHSKISGTCRPQNDSDSQLRCYFCDKVKNPEECYTTEEMETCNPSQAFCVTAMVYDPERRFKFINKGCRSADWCESNEVRDKSCCTTPLCNTGGLPEKSGYCPLVDRNQVGTCEVECSADSDCEGEKKCCNGPCGFGHCETPLDIKPVPCREDVELAQCLVSPCDVETCPNFEEAECAVNYCDGCHAQFVMPDGTDVTSSCHTLEPAETCGVEFDEGETDGCEAETVLRFFYNPTTFMCEEFSYTGCGGNDNNFATEDECLNTCQPVCGQRIDPGPCSEEIPSWGFNMMSGECEQFKFGGCGGNLNRFHGKVACLQKCVGEDMMQRECTVVEEELLELSKTWKRAIFVVPLKIKCMFLRSDIKPKAEQILGRCYLQDVQEMILNKTKEMLDFDWSLCDTEEENQGGEEENQGGEEELICNSRKQLREECFIEINPTDSTQDHCSDFQAMVDCVENRTAGCLPLQLVPIYSEFAHVNASLIEAEIQCTISMQEPREDSLEPLQECLHEYMYMFSDGMSNGYLTSGDARDMCSASKELRQCIYGISNLPVKQIVSYIMDMAEDVDRCLCEDVDDTETDPPVPVEPLQCYSCHRENDNDVCNEQIETCAFNKQSCQTVFERKDNVTTVSKGCKNPTAADAMTKTCKTVPSKFFCRYVCYDNLCNEPLYPDAVERKKRQSEEEPTPEVNEADSCKYSDFGALAEEHLTELLTLPLMHSLDYEEFCSSLEDTAARVMEYKTGCSINMTSRIDAVSSCFARLAETTCPQPITVEEEEEDEDESSCNWTECFEPILPFYVTLSTDEECSLIPRAIDCVNGMLPACNSSQRSAIASSFKTLHGIVPNGPVVEKITEAVCEVGKPDQVCDLEEATECVLSYTPEVFESNEQKCLKNKNLEACIRYHTEKCGDSDEKNNLLDIITALSDCPEDTDITADYDPNQCDFAEYAVDAVDACDIITAANASLEFINGGNADDCENPADVLAVSEVKDEVQNNIFGCLPLPFAVIETSFIKGTSCIDSLTVGVEDHPWSSCIRNFVNDFAFDDVCGSFRSLEECFTTTAPASSVDYHMMSANLDQLKAFNEMCSNPEEELPTDDTCQHSLTANCILTNGLLYMFAPYLPVTQKQAICDGHEFGTQSCMDKWDSCSSQHIVLMKDFFDKVRENSQMCEEPADIECPRDPEESGEPEGPTCDPAAALSIISELGISVSKCINSKPLQDKLCRSIGLVEMRIQALIKDCPEQVQHKVLLSSTVIMHIVDRVCKGDKPDDVTPDLDNTPLCLREDYTSRTGSCEPFKAIQCLAVLEQEVFRPQGTEDRFCLMYRYAVKCFMDYTTNCDPFIGTALNPLIENTLTIFNDRCPETWCPVEEEPENCDVTAAQTCLHTLQISIEKQRASCGLVTETIECITRVTVDCGPSERMLVAQIMKRVKFMSVIACRVIEEPEVDPMACIARYKELGLQLLDMSPYSYWRPEDGSEEDDTNSGSSNSESSGSTGKSGKGSSGKNTKESSEEDGTNSGSSDSESSGSTGKSGKGSSGKSTKESSKEDGTNSGSSGSESSGSTGKSGKGSSGKNTKESSEEDGTNSGSSDSESSGSTGKSGKGSSGKNTKESSKEDGTNSGSSDSELSGSTGKSGKGSSGKNTKESSKSGKGNLGKNTKKSSGKGSGKSHSRDSEGSSEVSESRDSWIEESEIDYANHVMRRCEQLDRAWQCVEASLELLTLKKKTVVSKMIKGIRDAVKEKCRPIQCHACNGLNNRECNRQATCSCPTHQQMCYAKYEEGGYVKGCAGPAECEECRGLDNCYCCEGHKCNAGEVDDEPEVCNPSMAIECAFELIFVSLETEELQLNLIQTQLQCIIEHTQGCKTKRYHMLFTVCVEIESIFELGTCVSNYGDPLCGTAGILALDYVMNNPLRDAAMFSVCRQYHATSVMVTNIQENSEVCTDEQIGNLHDSLTFAEQQLSGFCVPPADPPRVCDVERADEDCIQTKIWLIDGQAECSVEMVAAFTKCITDLCSECNSMERSALYIPVKTYLEYLPSVCEDDNVFVQDEVMATIFVQDEFTTLVSSYIVLVEQIQTTLIRGTLNFHEDLCNYVFDFKATISAYETSQLQKSYLTKNSDALMKQLLNVCRDTSVTDDDVADECLDTELDIYLALDTSGSIGVANFELIRQFASDVISLANLENGKVRMGALLFESEVLELFSLSDHTTEHNGVKIQDKDILLDIIANMTYLKGKTNTAAALDTAKNDLHGADEERSDVHKVILLLTDGKSSSEDTIAQAIQTKRSGIEVFCIGIKMEEQDQIEELQGIASSPVNTHVLRLEDFADLAVVYRKIFRQFCRGNTKSECDFANIVTRASSTLMHSMTSSYFNFGSSTAICSKIQSELETIDTLSLSCARYQINAIQLIQSMSQTEFCLLYEQVDIDPECDITRATMCVTDIAPFVTSAYLGDSFVCWKVSAAVECLNFHAGGCEDKGPILQEVNEVLSIIGDRCPEEVTSLRCWATEDEAEVVDDDEDSKNKKGVCNIVAMVAPCVRDIDWGSLAISFNPCDGLFGAANDAFTCAFETFVNSRCDISLLTELENQFLTPGGNIHSAINAGGLCPVPTEFEYELPEGYGVEEIRECEVVPICNLTTAPLCLENLQITGEGCRNWAEIDSCISGHIEGCGRVDKAVFKMDIHVKVTQAFAVPDSCLTGYDLPYTDCHAFDITTTGNCEMMQNYLECIGDVTEPAFVSTLYQTSLDKFKLLVDDVCYFEVVEEEENSDCAVTPEEQECVNDYINMAYASLFMSQTGKQRICDLYRSELSECIERKPACSRAQPAGRLWEALSLAQAYIHIHGVCNEAPLTCSVQTASACISDLTEVVTMYDYIEGDSLVVCSTLAYTRSCLELTLTACDLNRQASLISTFKNVECLALDICTSDDWEVEDPDREPVECIDPQILPADATCMPVKAYNCIHDFELAAKNPFARNTDEGCLKYSDMLTCVYSNIHGCSDTDTGLVNLMLNLTMEEYAQYIDKCPTVIRSPCKEEEECELTEATTCIAVFYENLEFYREAGTICQYIDEVQICVNRVRDACSATAVADITAMFTQMVEDADVSCTNDFSECSSKYVNYINKIIQWKTCEEPEEIDESGSESGSELSESGSESEESAESTASATKDSKKTSSKDSKKTSSKDSKKTSSKDSKKTSSKDSKKSRRRRQAESEEEGATKETASKESATKKSATKKSATKESATKKSASKDSATKSKKSATKSKKSATKSQSGSAGTPSSGTDETSHLEDLDRMCKVFFQAWECVQDTWSSLDDSIFTVVQSTFLTYHSTVMDICRGHKAGYCEYGSNRMNVEGCMTDIECNGDQKCCSFADTAVCMRPLTLDYDCCQAFTLTSELVLSVIQSLYVDFTLDKGQRFCSLYLEYQSSIEASLSMSTCPSEYFLSLKVTWEAALTAYESFCLVEPPQHSCDEEAALVCLGAYNSRDAGASNSEKCTLFETLTFCLRPILEKCDDTIPEDLAVITTMNEATSKISDSLECSDIPDIVISNVCASALVIREGEIPGTTVAIKLAQDPQDVCQEGSTCEVKIEFDMIQDEKKMPRCSNKNRIQQIVGNYMCDMVFTSENWNEVKNLTLTARLDGKKDGNFKAELDIKASLYVDGVQVQSKPIQNCEVVVRDADKKGMCSSVNDPHISTFDGLKYDNHLQGEFVLYKSTYLPYEVRLLLTTCKFGSRKSASCNCGVSARAGDDVILISRCSGTTEKILYLNEPLTKNFRFYEGDSGKEITIVFPSGAKLFVVLEQHKSLKAGESKLLNVYLVPSPLDRGRTLGMCGIYDNDRENDIHDSDGIPFEDIDIEDYTESWAYAWKVESDYQFLGVNADPDLMKIEDLCPLSSADDQCSCNLNDLAETCELKLGTEFTTSAEIVQTGQTRRKRAVGDPFAGLNINVSALPVLATFPTESGITFDQAYNKCRDALTGAAFADTCANILEPTDLDDKIQNCVDDIKFMDNLETDFIQSTIDAFSKQCEEEAKTSTNTTLIDAIKDVTCPSQCSGHGTCQNSTCECEANYRSVDCSIDITLPPPVDQLSDTLCQSTIDGTCASVTVRGDDFVPEAVCHLETVTVTVNGINKTGSTVKNVPATWISLEEVSCDLTQSGSLPLHAVLVSVSNNGEIENQSDQHLYIAHNPICFSCTRQEQMEGTCQKERASCHVNGVCYRPLEPSQEDPCFICDVYTEQMIYQVSENCPAPSTTTEEPYLVNQKAREANDSLVIGLSAGAAALVLVVVVIVVLVMFMRHLKMKSKRSDTKDLTHRSSSGRDSEDGDAFGEVVYPAFGNYGYQGYPVQGYPAMYMEAPQDVFVNNIPKRHSSRHSDPTRNSNDNEENRRSRHHREDYYDNRA